MRTDVRAGRQPVRRVELEVAVHLVGEEQSRPRPRRSRRPPRYVARSGRLPVGLCGALTTISRVRGVTCAAEQLDVDRPPVVGPQLVERHVGARRPGDLVEALVGGPHDDRVVAGLEVDVGDGEDRLLGAAEHDDVVRGDGLVQRRDLAPQQRDGPATPCSRGEGRATAPRSRHRPSPGARPSAGPRRRTHTAGGARRTRTARRTARARSRRSATGWSQAGRTVSIADQPTGVRRARPSRRAAQGPARRRTRRGSGRR